MPLPSFDDLRRDADQIRPGVPVAVAGGADATVLEALRQACDGGWVVPHIFGRETDIRQTAEACGVGLHGFELVDADQPATAAVAQVRSGRARILMKGQIATPALMKAVLDPTDGLRTGRVICQVVLMELLPAGRRFLLGDTGISIQPTLEQKADILNQAVAVAHALGADEPNVAIMAATESVVDAMPETVDAAELVRRNRAGQLTGCQVHGPLSFDLAFDRGAAGKKRLDAEGMGAADVMIFPNLVSANLTVKAIMYTAACRFGGILCGAASPVVFMSRADTTETRLNSLALALAIAREL